MKDDRIYLSHIRDSIDLIFYYSVEGEKVFRGDKKTQDAVIRNFEIIGEASKRLSDGIKSAHPNIPWKSIAGMLDKLIHDYFGVNLDIVWDTITGFLPTLRTQVIEILKETDTLT